MMKLLIGTWQGTGFAQFPTINDTPYREVLTFTAHDTEPILHVVQKTWRILPDNQESLLFWESGFVRQLDGMTCEWTNAQSNGRAEVLKGRLTVSPGKLIMDLGSVAFANDARMIQSTRIFEVTADSLTYTLAMATTAHPHLTNHLQAELHRQHE